jgi:hypothetical protein
MSHIEPRRNRYYAVLTVPEDVQHLIGTKRYVKSTQTGDRAEATLRAAILVAGWKAEIAKARGTLPSPEAGFWANLRREFINAQDEAHQMAIEGVAEAAAAKVKDPEEASLLYRVATGQAPERVPLGPLVTAWKGSLGKLAQKTIDQAHRDVSRMAEHFQHLDALTPPKVLAWTEKLRVEGMTAASFERIGKGCRSFWTYLQQSGTVSLIHPHAFEGAFRLAQRAAPRTDTGRSGSSYTPEQLAGLYSAALDKGDKPLADLIALGAYTGARIEELCKLTKATCADGVFRMGTKTEASRRETPIHPAVAPLVARMLAASTDGFLVPSTADNQYNNRSGPLSQRFGHLKTAHGFGRSHVFHSTRNTLITMMERAGVPEGIAADVVGHEKKTMTYGLYGSGSAKEQKLQALALVKYPGALGLP